MPASRINDIPTGIVSADQFDAVLGNWGNTYDALQQVAMISAMTGLSEEQVTAMIVPEPGVAALLAPGALLMLRRRRVAACA